MTLRLILVRHAKSSWADPGQPDQDRPLNKRGRKAAAAMGAWLAARECCPAEVVTSPARRTLETWERMAPAFPADTLMRREPALYDADPEAMVAVLRHCAVTPVLMLGHNPGISEFAASLLKQTPDHPKFATYPTCAALIADFEIEDWADLRPGTGRAVDFVTPSDLSD